MVIKTKLKVGDLFYVIHESGIKKFSVERIKIVVEGETLISYTVMDDYGETKCFQESLVFDTKKGLTDHINEKEFS